MPTLLDSKLRTSLIGNISKKAQGSIIYARLMVDELTFHYLPKLQEVVDLQSIESWFPNTLEDLYNRILLEGSIRSGASRGLQLTALQCMPHSPRPMHLLELAALLDHLDKQKRKNTEDVIHESCAPLLEIKESGEMSLIHHSVTDFMADEMRKPGKASENIYPQFPLVYTSNIHRSIASICLRYLTSGCFSSWDIKERKFLGGFSYHNSCRISDESYKTSKIRNSFLDYAITLLPYHVSRIEEAGKGFFAELDTFINSKAHDFKSWLDIFWQDIDLSKTSPLHIAAYTGMSGYARHLIGQGHNCDDLDVKQRTPLSWASEKGYTEIVKLLLENGAIPDTHDWYGHKPMHYAARENHHEVVKVLLGAGVSPLTPKTKVNPSICGNILSVTERTPVLYACKGGNMETILEMIPYLKSEELNTCLCTAAEFGRTGLVDLLVTMPEVSADPPGKANTPLFIASSKGDIDTMSALLRMVLILCDDP